MVMLIVLRCSLFVLMGLFVSRARLYFRACAVIRLRIH